ncbi:MAG: lipoate--protein ligase family protein [Candidatus Coatesbacteria bacterium]|nr:lipoate--protein ligase family protein [Candidatus Coatesbacteria bacterium]
MSFSPATDDAVLRLYCWERPCVSLGYFQRADDAVKRASCEEHGVDIVRRITGGRAVLHDQEITYCLVASVKTGPFAGRLLECYQAIAACLSTGCELLGIPGDEIEVKTGQEARAGSSAAACFMMTSAYEILVSGRKLIGSAQKRGDEVFVQHGSIPLRIDMPLTLNVMHVDGVKGAVKSGGQTAGPAWLEGIVGRSLTFDEVKAAIKEGFARRLGTSIERSNLTESERTLADALSLEKYGDDSWNFRR